MIYIHKKGNNENPDNISTFKKLIIYRCVLKNSMFGIFNLGITYLTLTLNTINVLPKNTISEGKESIYFRVILF